MNKICFVIGHSGFLGNEIFKFLKKKKLVVFGYNRKNIKKFFENKLITKYKNQVNQGVLIFAAGVHRAYGDSKKLKKYNERLTQKILKASKFYNIKIIFLSTVEVYGKPKKNFKINEKSKLKPFNNYSKGKIFQNKEIIKFSKKKGISYLILRLPGIYGKNYNDISIVTKILAAFKNKIFTLNGNGEQRRDYVYLNDLVKLIHKLLSSKYKNIIINVATGVSFSLNEIIDMFKKS